MEPVNERKQFSVAARAHSLRYALRGIYLFFKSQHNAWVQLVIAIIVVVAGFFFAITSMEWIFVIFSIMAVFSAEAFNTAIEIHMNLTSPNPHPHARDTKDVAAGAVLLTVIGAIIVGFLVFTPYIISFCTYYFQ
ncbi:MAG TPA: diacylglycerol kinase family protein [Candidatus Paceibacterota bacterium]|nr:diacylglycerol kinase family protein [Candidatus Paceibacterota bacterium]